ncbi:MAG: SGNH/GDSL hydrolase family protein [Planctomycetes bacterium]|nr:SGNH/GDSL hydrolase family protein [Planctomycetota bacterium]
MASLPKKLLLASAALALACGLGEGLLRLLQPAAVGVSRQPRIYVRDETNGFAYLPGGRDRLHRLFEMDAAVVINRAGFHDVERTAAGDSPVWRVAALGDSFTACLHVPVAAGWTQILEHELGRRRGTRGEVHNLGLDGTGTDVQVRILAAQLARGLRIDTAILAFYGNDADDVALGPLYREVVDRYVITYQDQAQRSAILQHLAAQGPAAWLANAYDGSLLVRAVTNLTRGDALLRSNFVGPAQVGLRIERRRAAKEPLEQAFRDLAALARRHSFAVLVAPVPARSDPRGSLQVLTQSVAASVLQHCTVVDVVPALERRLAAEHVAYDALFWRHDDHLNAAGNRQYALALADGMPAR